MLVKKENISSS